MQLTGVNQTEDSSVPKREPKLFTFKIFLGKLLYRKSAKKLCSQKAKDNNNNNFSRKAKDNMEIDEKGDNNNVDP